MHAHRRRALALITGLVAISAAAAAFGEVTSDRSLSDRLTSVVGSHPLRGARVSALVVRESDGEILFEHMPDRALTPASNLKILTALAALDAFGPTHQFETRVLASAPPDENGAVETLFVVGGGDPVLNSEDWWRLAAELRRLGLRSVRGALVMDDSLFDRVRWHPGWGKTSARAYHAPVGALTANYGSFGVTVQPGARRGDPVGVVVDPPVDYLAVENRATTGSSVGRNSLVVDRSAGPKGEIVTVAGVVRAGDPPKTFYRSVLDPTRYAGAVFRSQLAANGIRVAGPDEVARVPEDAYELLLAFEGRPLAEIVRLFVKFSNNAVAETLVKDLGVRRAGGPGSWAEGVRALESQLSDLGLEGAGTVVVDGSGLSYDNKVAPRTLVQALRLAGASFRFGPELISALPIAAEDGTLEKRAEGSVGEVRAKTGLLNRVTGLSGFARLSDGQRAVFSILVNGYSGTDEVAMAALDRFAAELVRSTDAPRTASVGD